MRRKSMVAGFRVMDGHATRRDARTLGLLLVACALGGCGGGGGGSEATVAPQAAAAPAPAPTPGAPGSWTLVDASVEPYAQWDGTLASTPLTVRARTRDARNVVLSVEYFDGLPGGTGAQRRTRLYDDGTHGDSVPGDGMWTLAFVPDVVPPAALRLYDGRLDSIALSIVAHEADGDVVAPANAIDARVEVGVVDRGLDGEFESREVASDVHATDWMLNVVAPGFDGQALGPLLRRAYVALGVDAFDFAVVFHTRTTGDGIPRSIGVRNDVRGIHRPLFDDSAAYGSAGRLQQIVFQNARALGVEVNHEIGHRWGAFLDDPTLDLAIPTGFHWGPSTHVGQMGSGPYLEAAGANGFLATNAHGSESFAVNPFSLLELYLMGLVGRDEVAPLEFVTDRSVAVRFGEHLPASAVRTVTIADIEAVYGPRVPAADASPNAFTALFVTVSDRPLDAAERALSSHVARYAAGASEGGVRAGGLFAAWDPPAFSAATGFRATLETALPLSAL
jgi:hypothetical protein